MYLSKKQKRAAAHATTLNFLALLLNVYALHPLHPLPLNEGYCPCCTYGPGDPVDKEAGAGYQLWEVPLQRGGC